MAWVSPATLGVGVLVDVDDLNQVLRDNMSALYDPPRVRLMKTGDVNVVNEFEKLDWSDVYSVDSGNLWSSGDSKDINPSLAGRYALTFTAQLNTESIGIMYGAILQNDLTHLAVDQYSGGIVASFTWTVHCNVVAPLTTDDAISAWVLASTGTITVDAISTEFPQLSAWWVGD